MLTSFHSVSKNLHTQACLPDSSPSQTIKLRALPRLRPYLLFQPPFLTLIETFFEIPLRTHKYTHDSHDIFVFPVMFKQREFGRIIITLRKVKSAPNINIFFYSLLLCLTSIRILSPTLISPKFSQSPLSDIWARLFCTWLWEFLVLPGLWMVCEGSVKYPGRKP
jgi:hypothetical protein